MVACSISSHLGQPQGSMQLRSESDTWCVQFQMEYRKNIKSESLIIPTFLKCWANRNSLALVIPCASSLWNQGLLDSIFPLWCYTNRPVFIIHLSIRVFLNISSFRVWTLSNIALTLLAIHVEHVLPSSNFIFLGIIAVVGSSYSWKISINQLEIILYTLVFTLYIGG